MASMEKLIVNHLDLWASAIKRKSAAGRGASGKFELYGIKKLRELILELAVRGLLVPQNPTDEPASELLSRIASEKTKLAIAGKIRKEKPLRPVSDKEKSFDLPTGWEWAKLGMLMEMFNGRAFKQTEWSSDGLPIIRIQNLNDKNAPFNYFNGDLSENNYVVPGTFLISWSGTPGTSFGAFIWNDTPGALNQHINKCMIFGEEISKEYLKLAVNSCMDHLIDNAQGGVGLKHVTKGTLNNCVFAIPPLAEQHRIVAKVDQLMALCDQLECQTEASLTAHTSLVDTFLNALTNYSDHAQFVNAWQRIATHFDILFTTADSIDRLKKVVLYLAANGVLVKCPAPQKRVLLKEILSFGPRNGFSPKESTNETLQKVLKLGATSYGKLDLSQTKSFNDEIQPASHLWLKEGDILVQRGNSHKFVGSSVLIQEDTPSTIYPDLMMKLRVNEEALPSYVSFFISSPQAREHMWNGMTGTSGTMPKISKAVVETIPIVLPPIYIQNKIVSEVNYLLTLCDHLKSCLNDAQTTHVYLTDAIAKKALART